MTFWRATASLLAALVLSAGVPGARAQDPSTCTFGGPAGTFSVAKVDLPQGAPQLAVRITTPIQTAMQPTALAGDRSSWHLATALAILDANGRLLASRLQQSGSSPRRVVVTYDGTGVAHQDFVGPGAPFNHQGGAAPDTLPAGTYYVVAFGSDGDARIPNPAWSAQVTFGRSISCLPLNLGGTVFDHDQTDFSGGTQIAAYGAGSGSELGLRWHANHPLNLTLLDAATQLVGSSTLQLRGPDGRSATVTDGMGAVSGSRGTYTVRGAFRGAFPLLLAAGVSIELPLTSRER
jgi:hypothetical protein